MGCSCGPELLAVLGCDFDSSAHPALDRPATQHGRAMPGGRSDLRVACVKHLPGCLISLSRSCVQKPRGMPVIQGLEKADDDRII